MTIILTHMGRYLDLAAPEGYDFPIEEIAIGLARQPRFSGQTITAVGNWYAGLSVAQHSTRVSRLVPPEIALQALLHDAHEAYIGDASTPWKDVVPGYREAELRVAAALRDAHGLPAELDERVHQMDLLSLRAERRWYMPDALASHPRGFPTDWESGPEIRARRGSMEFRARGPYNACNEFLLRYYELVSINPYWRRGSTT